MKNAKIKQLFIGTEQGFAGRLRKDSQFVFGYDNTATEQQAIGLMYPVRPESYNSSLLPWVLQQNMPEGFLRDFIQERMAKVMLIDDMSILSLIGHDMIGRLSCSTDQLNSPKKKSTLSLEEMLHWDGAEQLFDILAEEFALSSGIAGVQPKIVVPSQCTEKTSLVDTCYILKSGGADYPGLAENEFHCMTIAKKAGVVTADFWLSDDKALFITKRFDALNGEKLGFEDITSLAKLQNREKYNGSYEGVAKYVNAFSSPAFKIESMRQLFKSIVVSMILGNGDAHLKNFGLLYTSPASPDVHLSPAYDIVNTIMYIPKDVPALNMHKAKRWPTWKELADFGRRSCYVNDPDAIIAETLDIALSYSPEGKSPVWEAIRASVQMLPYVSKYENSFNFS